MPRTVFYLIMLQKYISSKQRLQNKKTSLVFRKCFGISGGFSANKMSKTGLNGYVDDFSVNYRAFDTSNFIDIHKYLMKKHGKK